MSRGHSRKILSVSRSTPLLIGRNDMLALAGYAVSSPRQPLDALRLLEDDGFIAVLIGHSVYPEEARVIAAKAAEMGVPAVFVYQGRVAIPEWADLAVETDSGISQLLNFLAQRGRIAS